MAKNFSDIAISSAALSPEVADATGISQERLRAYEAGTSVPSGDEILILSDYYMCDYKFFISNEKLAPFEETETMFRRYGEEFSREDRWAVQEFLFLSECEHFLRQGLGKQPQKRFQFKATRSTQAKFGELAATQLRAYLAYPDTGVPLREQFEESYSLALQYRLASRSVTN